MFGLSTSQRFENWEVRVEENYNGLCRELWVYDNLSLSRVMARVFSLKKHSLTYVSNVCIYSVGRDLVYQIWKIGKTECFAGISREGEVLAKTSWHHLSWLFAFQSCAEHMLHLARRILVSYPWKLLQFALSFHTFSHTQPLQWNHTWNTGYKRLNKITIKFGMELKPT